MSLKNIIEEEYLILCSENRTFLNTFKITYYKKTINFTYNAIANNLREYYHARDLIITMIRNITKKFEVNKIKIINENFKLQRRLSSI